MRLVTWNIRAGRGIDEVRSLQRIIDVLREIDADIVCLQEVERRMPSSGFEDQPAKLAVALGMTALFQTNLRLGPGAFGNAILSRYPLTKLADHALPNPRERAGILRYPEKRRALEVAVQHLSSPLTVFVTHWSLDSHDRLKSARILAERVKRANAPVIAAGDFNAEERSDEILRFREESELIDSWPQGEMTYPADVPNVRIDYVWHSREIQVQSARSASTLASDHLPVIVEW